MELVYPDTVWAGCMVPIRDAALGDAAAIVTLLGQLGYEADEPMVRERLAAYDASPLAFTLVAVDAQPVGVLAFHVTPTFHERGGVGRITTLVVLEGHRGSGVGAALVTEAERRAKAMGCARIELTSGARRDDAHRFYENLGYRRTGVRFLRHLTDEQARLVPADYARVNVPDVTDRASR